MGIFIGLAFVLTYYLIFWVNYDGATPGKKLLGIKITKANGEKLTYPVAFIRYVGYTVSGATIFFFGLGYLWIIWDKKKQALHDKIAGTVVIRTEKKSQVALAILLTMCSILMMFGFMTAVMIKGFSLGLKEAQQRKGVLSESFIQKRLLQNQEQDASEILSFAPSSCGLSIPIPKTTDTYKEKERKWLYEEVSLATNMFYVLDKDVFPAKEVQGAFLGYKDADARLAGENFNVSFPGLNIYCVNNIKSFSLDEYLSLALANKNYTVQPQKKTIWGEVELYPVTLEGVGSDGKQFKENANLGLTKDGTKLLYIRIWGPNKEDTNEKKIINGLDIIVRNLKYRNQDGSSSNTNSNSSTNIEINSNVQGVSTGFDKVKSQ